MKKIIAILAVAALSCSAIQAQSFLSKLFGGSKNTTTTTTTTTTQVSQAQQQGQSSGKALKAIYDQYIADGKKFEIKNNLLSLLTLSSSLQGIKDQAKGSGFYTDFGKGLLLGSTGLVKEETQDNVISGLQTIASQLNTSELQQAAATTSSVISNGSQLASSVTSLLGLFK
ncbi:MAG: hypothetical protein HUJ89_06440 [Bacteroidales bacterium]|nr:hypothetical protein [Bacteroidales bacterium]